MLLASSGGHEDAANRPPMRRPLPQRSYIGLQTWLALRCGVGGVGTKITACLSFENQGFTCRAAMSENLYFSWDAENKQDLRILKCILIFPLELLILFVCLLTCIWNTAARTCRIFIWSLSDFSYKNSEARAWEPEKGRKQTFSVMGHIVNILGFVGLKKISLPSVHLL